MSVCVCVRICEYAPARMRTFVYFPFIGTTPDSLSVVSAIQQQHQGAGEEDRGLETSSPPRTDEE